MARVHGKNGTVSVSGSSVGAVSSWSFDASKDEIDATAMGDTAKQYLTGLEDGSGTIEIRFDGSDSGQTALKDAYDAGSTITVDLGIDGTYGYSGDTCVITNFSIGASYDDVVNITYGFRGGLTKY